MDNAVKESFDLLFVDCLVLFELLNAVSELSEIFKLQAIFKLADFLENFTLHLDFSSSQSIISLLLWSLGFFI